MEDARLHRLSQRRFYGDQGIVFERLLISLAIV